MKQFFLLVFIGITLGVSASSAGSDTSDYWVVKRNGRVILKGSAITHPHTITITKGTLLETDIFEIEYFADATSASSVLIKNRNGEIVEQLSPYRAGAFQLKTKEIQKMSHREAGGILRFFCLLPVNEGLTVELFAVEVK